MRAASDSDFVVSVEGVGDFSFARRTVGDAIKIRREYLRLCGDTGDADLELSLYSNVVAAIKVLCVSAPDGWGDVEKLDLTASANPLDDLLRVFDALKEKEDSFRRQSTSGS